MDCIEDFKRIEDESEEAQLRERYERLVALKYKQELLISVIQNVNQDEIDGISADNRNNIKKCLDFIRAYPYLKLNSSDGNALGKK